MEVQAIENALRDINYPTDKGGLLQAAEQKGLTELKPLLHQLPQQTFGSAEEVLDKLPLSKLGSMFGL